MNVLLIGYGSIGARHAVNLAERNDIDKIIICSKNRDITNGNINGKRYQFVETVEEVLPLISSLAVTFAIVSNETYKHIDTALLLVKQNLHMIIEKPLSHNLKRTEELQGLSIKKGIKVGVGYNLRYLGAIRHIKKLLIDGLIGKLYFARIEAGQYLPQWRPRRDYRSVYSAIKEKGGGVALDLSHEIDYMRFLFGNPEVWKVTTSKVSDLAISSRDVFEGIYTYKSGFICNVHLDYLQQQKTRKIQIVGSGGTIVCDLMNKRLEVTSPSGVSTVLEDESLFDVPGTYKEEIGHFIEIICKKGQPDITIRDGIEALRLIEDKNDREL